LVRFHATLGQAIKAEDPLFEIQDVSGFWLQGRVLERDLARVRVGQRARASLLADDTFVANGVVRRVAPAFDAEDRTLASWAEAVDQNTRPFPVGMLARLALIVAEPEPALAVPRSAIHREGEEAYVFVRRTDGTFERRAVRTGRADDQYVQVTEGLHEGE